MEKIMRAEVIMDDEGLKGRVYGAKDLRCLIHAIDMVAIELGVLTSYAGESLNNHERTGWGSDYWDNELVPLLSELSVLYGVDLPKSNIARMIFPTISALVDSCISACVGLAFDKDGNFNEELFETSVKIFQKFAEKVEHKDLLKERIVKKLKEITDDRRGVATDDQNVQKQ